MERIQEDIRLFRSPFVTFEPTRPFRLRSLSSAVRVTLPFEMSLSLPSDGAEAVTTIIVSEATSPQSVTVERRDRRKNLKVNLRRNGVGRLTKERIREERKENERENEGKDRATGRRVHEKERAVRSYL